MTARLHEKGGMYYCVISYKEDGQYRQKWISLGLPTSESKIKATELMEEKKIILKQNILLLLYLKTARKSMRKRQLRKCSYRLFYSVSSGSYILKRVCTISRISSTAL